MWVMTSVETLGYSRASLRDKGAAEPPRKTTDVMG